MRETIKRDIKRIFNSSLQRLNPSLLIKDHIGVVRSEYQEGGFEKIVLVGFGKASYQMTEAFLEEIDNDLVSEGVIITKYGHKSSNPLKHKVVKVFEAGHPIPDVNGLKATNEIVGLLKRADEKTMILSLISGGGSALLVSPYNGITLQDKQKAIDLLLKAGADIFELNTVRKHISDIKGGRFVEIAHPASIMSLIISDVIGDRLDVIASGPSCPDTSVFSNAVNVLDKYDLIDKVPISVKKILTSGQEGRIPETPKPDNPLFKDVRNIIIGSNRIGVEAARAESERLGYRTEILSMDITGEARKVGNELARKAIERSNELRLTGKGKKLCLVSGGETTVTVKGDGKGGRNMELALGFAGEIEGIDGITLLSAGTDGTDGPTDAAGAVVDGETVLKAKVIGLDPELYLNNNDSYNFFDKVESLLITGPTGTNIMDMQIIIIE